MGEERQFSKNTHPSVLLFLFKEFASNSGLYFSIAREQHPLPIPVEWIMCFAQTIIY